MRRFPGVIALLALVLTALLGLRGVGHLDRNYFTMQPFSDPLVHCTVSTANGSPLPERLYGRFSQQFTGRLYLEQLPAYQQGIEQYLQTPVSILCQSVHLPPYQVRL